VREEGGGGLEVVGADVAVEVVGVDPDPVQECRRDALAAVVVDPEPFEVLGQERRGRPDLASQVDELCVDRSPRGVVVDDDVDRQIGR